MVVVLQSSKLLPFAYTVYLEEWRNEFSIEFARSSLVNVWPLPSNWRHFRNKLKLKLVKLTSFLKWSKLKAPQHGVVRTRTSTTNGNHGPCHSGRLAGIYTTTILHNDNEAAQDNSPQWRETAWGIRSAVTLLYVATLLRNGVRQPMVIGHHDGKLRNDSSSRWR